MSPEQPVIRRPRRVMIAILVGQGEPVVGQCNRPSRAPPRSVQIVPLKATAHKVLSTINLVSTMDHFDHFLSNVAILLPGINQSAALTRAQGDANQAHLGTSKRRPVVLEAASHNRTQIPSEMAAAIEQLYSASDSELYHKCRERELAMGSDVWKLSPQHQKYGAAEAPSVAPPSSTRAVEGSSEAQSPPSAVPAAEPPDAVSSMPKGALSQGWGKALLEKNDRLHARVEHLVGENSKLTALVQAMQEQLTTLTRYVRGDS